MAAKMFLIFYVCPRLAASLLMYKHALAKLIVPDMSRSKIHWMLRQAQRKALSILALA